MKHPRIKPKKDSKEITMLVTPERLAKIYTDAPQDRIDEYAEVFNDWAENYGIQGDAQINFFLTQVKFESGNDLSFPRENLNYSVSALKSTFSYYKNSPGEADADGRSDDHSANQPNIGNKAYANRIGNGDVASGDGYRFRGGGGIQLTGRANYDSNANTISLVTGDPVSSENVEDEIQTVTMALHSALGFWFGNSVYTCGNIDETTAIINYYTDTYDERKALYQEIAAII